MKQLSFTLYLLLILANSYGQNKYAIKIYQNTDKFTAEYYAWNYGSLEKYEYQKFNRLSLALDIETKNKFTHEIELLIPELSKSTYSIQFPMNYEFRKDYGSTGKVSSYALRYELIISLSDKSKRFTFNPGVGINSYYVYIEFMPDVANAFNRSNKLYGFVFNITPRISYKLTNRFKIDVNVPLKVYDLREDAERIDNPAIPVRQQANSKTHSIFFENAYTIRLGLLYYLSK